MSENTLGLWRVWLPLGRLVLRWHGLQARAGQLPLVVGVGGAAGAGKSVALQLLRLVSERALAGAVGRGGGWGGAGKVIQFNLDELVSESPKSRYGSVVDARCEFTYRAFGIGAERRQ